MQIMSYEPNPKPCASAPGSSRRIPTRPPRIRKKRCRAKKHMRIYIYMCVCAFV